MVGGYRYADTQLMEPGGGYHVVVFRKDAFLVPKGRVVARCAILNELGGAPPRYIVA